MSYPSPRPKAWPSRFPPPRRRAAAGGGLHAPLTAAHPHLSNGRTARLFAASVRMMARPRPRPPPLPSSASCPLAFSSLRAFAGDPAYLHPGRAPRPCDASTRPGAFRDGAACQMSRAAGMPAAEAAAAAAERNMPNVRGGRACLPTGQGPAAPRPRLAGDARSSACLALVRALFSRQRGADGRTCRPCTAHCARPARVGGGCGRGGEEEKRGDAGCGTGRRVREKMKRV